MSKFRNTGPDTITGWLEARQVGLTYTKADGTEVHIKDISEMAADDLIKSARAIGGWGFVKYSTGGGK